MIVIAMLTMFVVMIMVVTAEKLFRRDWLFIDLYEFKSKIDNLVFE